MSQLLWPAAALACPVGMGLMMWMMMRGGGRANPSAQQQAIQQLRSEIEKLKADRMRNI
jgi:hypothetical protein